MYNFNIEMIKNKFKLYIERKGFMTMKTLTPQEQQRLWKQNPNPIRKILLWGKDSEKNPCLLILYGQHRTEREIRSRSHSYYPDAYLLEPTVTYTHYAVFHGINGHLPSIPNTYYNPEDDLLCYRRGYITAKINWKWDNEASHYRRFVEIDEKYIIKEFYKTPKKIAFDYYQQNSYTDYVSYLKSNNIIFEDFELIEQPSTLFGFSPESPYYDSIVNMFLKERLYTRRKYLSQFMKMNPSAEEYQRILKVASVELACGIFQELTIEKNPILLEIAKQIHTSKTLWAKKDYHSGLKRCVKQYIGAFDETLMQQQKEFIYKTLPEMDFHIKKLQLYNKTLQGEELEQYLSNPSAYVDLSYQYVFGTQKLYEKNTYTNGRDFYNVAFKNTIQTAKAYGMADVIGKIAYYLDAPRTSYYLKASGRTKTYQYYVRYIRRTLDEYKAADETKFIAAAKQMLTSYTDNDNINYYHSLLGNYFFNYYFKHTTTNHGQIIEPIWNRHIDDVIYIAKNAKTSPVHEFCYAILKQHSFDTYQLKELIVLSQIPYHKTAELFEKILLPKLEALQEFDAEIMLALMNTQSEKLQNAANKYFIRTNGKFTPENIANLFSLDTVETWYHILQSNINAFTVQEYIVFVKMLSAQNEYFLENQTEFSQQIKELLQNTTNKLDTAGVKEKQELLQYFVTLLSNNTKMPDFLAEMEESFLFYMPYDELKNSLQHISLQHHALSETNRNRMVLLKAIKEDIFPKDSAILSILETGSAKLVKILTEVIERLQSVLMEKTTALLLLLECNAYSLNKIAQTVFESMEMEKREKMHVILLDSPVEKVYQYGLQKLEDWYGNKTPKQFISRMLEHPCIAVKSYLSEKMEKAFSNLEQVQPDLYIYYVKTLLYLPNKASKSKQYVYSTMPVFLQYYPEKQKEIENILLDIGSTNSKCNAEKALVAFAQIQKEVCRLCK